MVAMKRTFKDWGGLDWSYWRRVANRRERRGDSAFSPLSLSPLIWIDPSDLSTLFKLSDGTDPVTADGDPVGYMADKSGNGNHLVQATAASRPTYHTSGGLHWIQGDGVDDWIRAAFTITQPWERISAIRQVTWTASDRIFGGGSVASGNLLQTGASPDVAMNSGVSLSLTDEAAIGQNMIITEKHNGASSRVAVNGNAYATGNAGATAPGGVTLFASNTGAADGNFRCYGFIMREGEMTDAQIAQARAYLATKSGVSL